MAKPVFKFKRVDAGRDRFSDQPLYQQIMMVEYDGKTSTYKTERHTSKQAVNDELNRMIAMINASVEGRPVNVQQNYGSAQFSTRGDEAIAKTIKEGGRLKAPETYALSSYGGGMQTIQEFDQRGIRQGQSVTRAPANMLDPDYDPVTDTIVRPGATGEAAATAQTDATARSAAFRRPEGMPATQTGATAQRGARAAVDTGAQLAPRRPQGQPMQAPSPQAASPTGKAVSARAGERSRRDGSLFSRDVSMIAGEGPASDMSPVTRMRSLLARRGMRDM